MAAGSAAGTSTAQAFSSASVGTAAGTSTAEAFSNQGTGVAAGVATAQAVGRSIFNAVGVAAGVATAQARWGYTYPALPALPNPIGFGVHTLLLHRTASSFGPVARFGTHSLVLSPPGVPPYLASSIEPGTQFGTPAVDLSLTVQATGEAPATAFGAATLRLRMPATSSAPATAFGTAMLRRTGIASGFSSTVFGTATLMLPPHLTTGRAPTTRFGTARLIGSSSYVAAGLQVPVQFGTAVLGGQRSRARAAGPNTRFGTAKLVQGLPP